MLLCARGDKLHVAVSVGEGEPRWGSADSTAKGYSVADKFGDLRVNPRIGGGVDMWGGPVGGVARGGGSWGEAMGRTGVGAGASRL